MSGEILVGDITGGGISSLPTSGVAVSIATNSAPVIKVTDGTWSVPMITSTGVAYCQPIQNYAWAGLDFALYGVGIFVILGGFALAYSVYKEYNGSPIVKKR